MSASAPTDTDVLIAGAGPVGLAFAVELGRRGVSCTVVEKRDGTPRVPRMSQVSTRSMEFCRRWGIAEAVKGAVWSSTHPLDYVYCASLTGEELGRFKVPSYAERGRLDFTPEGPCHCPQIYFDPILAELAASFPSVAMRYETALGTFTQDDEAVRAEIVSSASGNAGRITARFLVGCDGPGGMVREALGIGLDGEGVVANSINIFFRAPALADLHDKGWARFYRLIDEAGCWAELIAIDGEELWRLTVFHHDAPEFDAGSYLAKMAGADFPCEIIDATAWERRDYTASSYRRGRAFIAGDAAHQCSPTGGLGMHTGLIEAVNLSWKLAAVLEGWGGDALLASYDAECRPVAARNVAVATRALRSITGLPGRAGMRARMAEGDGGLGLLSVSEQIRTQFCYEGSPVCIPDGTPAPPEDARRFLPSARPGTRAPHGWLADGRSILDQFGAGFVLLDFASRAEGAAAIAKAAAERGVPLEVAGIDNADLARLYERALVLVRPDGQIAWRADAAPDDPGVLIDRVRGA